MTIVGGFTLGRTPLNVIQMLWVNLIMDVLGAIAIGTEPYKQDSDFRKSHRISRRDRIILPGMWRQVLVQSAYQILVMIIIMYFGGLMFFSDGFSLVYEPLRDENAMPTHRLVLDTILFHTFILMNLFNQINCRVVDDEEINVCKTLGNNPIFWAVFLGEIVI